MGILVKELGPGFGAEVRGLDLRMPLDDDTFAAVRDAFHRYAVLVLPGQALDDEQQIAFSLRFGPLETSISTIRTDRKRRVARPEISDISNVDAESRLLDPADERARYNAGNQLWHSDSSFKRVPAMASLLSAREVPPEGGETEFADLRAAWDTLPEERRTALCGLVAEHSIIYSRSLIGYRDFAEEERNALPPVQQALVRTHPATGRRSLYLGSHASHIVGWPVEEGRRLLRELLEFATQPRFVYRHAWHVEDLVMWDNRCVLHRGRPWDESRYRRVMHRTTVAGEGPT
ncbi:MAG: TauD/TfdA family dioxygenase [Candidatus Rokubacteria bacterium]|nr:TauD/TfdA family dioxygenase [Candidatus Rokubacteria bacterium]